MKEFISYPRFIYPIYISNYISKVLMSMILECIYFLNDRISPIPILCNAKCNFCLNSEIRRSIRLCSLHSPLEVNPIWEATQLAAWMWPNSMPMSLSMLLAPSPCLPMVAHKKVASQCRLGIGFYGLFYILVPLKYTMLCLEWKCLLEIYA